jgi:2-keto-myo-inositol isomerase
MSVRESANTASTFGRLDRRSLMAWSAISAAGVTAAALPAQRFASADESACALISPSDQRYCLNTSTVNGSAIPLRQQLKIAADAGYDGVELWVRDIEKFLNEGGKLDSLRNELSDLGLSLDSAIAFGAWLAEDLSQRQAALDQCRRDMDWIRQLGGSRIAAPPVGATNPPKLDLAQAAARYRELLVLGQEYGVVPQLEVWGFSHNLSTLAEALYVAAGANHPNACLLLDVYHLYKGGSDFTNMGLVPAAQMSCFHMNDYPSVPDRQTIVDKDRVYPGDGVAPIPQILRSFRQSGFRGTLSLELFNREYWQQPPEVVARTGLEKMQQVVELSFSSQ